MLGKATPTRAQRPMRPAAILFLRECGQMIIETEGSDDSAHRNDERLDYSRRLRHVVQVPKK